MNIRQYVIKPAVFLSLPVLGFMAGVLYESQSSLGAIEKKVYQLGQRPITQVVTVSQEAKNNLEPVSAIVKSSVQVTNLDQQRVVGKRLSDEDTLQNLMSGLFDVGTFDVEELEVINTLAGLVKDDPVRREEIITDIIDRIDVSYESDKIDHLYYLLRHFESEESNQKIASYALDLIQSGAELHRREMAYEMLSGNPAVNPVDALQIVLSNEIDPEMISAAISYIGVGANYVSEDKAQMLAIYDDLYTSTTESSIREAALNKLGNIASVDIIQKNIESALNDSDQLVRSRMLTIIRERKDLHTDINKQKLFSLLTNDLIDKDELKDVYFALSGSGFDLDDGEYRQLLSIKKRLNIF